MCSRLTESFGDWLIYRRLILVVESTPFVTGNSSSALEGTISLVASDLSMLFSTIKLLNYMRLELNMPGSERFSIFDYVLLMVNCENGFILIVSVWADLMYSFINIETNISPLAVLD